MMQETSCAHKISLDCVLQWRNKKTQVLAMQHMILKKLPVLHSPSAGNGLWPRRNYHSRRLCRWMHRRVSRGCRTSRYHLDCMRNVARSAPLRCLLHNMKQQTVRSINAWFSCCYAICNTMHNMTYTVCTFCTAQYETTVYIPLLRDLLCIAQHETIVLVCTLLMYDFFYTLCAM